MASLHTTRDTLVGVSDRPHRRLPGLRAPDPAQGSPDDGPQRPRRSLVWRVATPLVGLEGGLFHYFREDWRWDVDVSLGTRRATLQLPTLSGPGYRYTLLTVGSSAIVAVQW